MKILVSEGFGAGWSTWNYDGKDERVYMLTYQPFIDALMNGKKIDAAMIDQFNLDYEQKFPDGDRPCVSECAVEDLHVEDVDKPFVVREHDGNEWVVTRDEVDWIVP